MFILRLDCLNMFAQTQTTEIPSLQRSHLKSKLHSIPEAFGKFIEINM